MYYRIKNNKLYDYADFKYVEDCEETNIITQVELLQHFDKIIVKDNKLMLNPNYNKEHATKLQCKKHDLVLSLEDLGLDYYEQIKPLIESDKKTKLEWELNEKIKRTSPLLNTIIEKLKISTDKIDALFMYANNEISIEEYNKVK